MSPWRYATPGSLVDGALRETDVTDNPLRVASAAMFVPEYPVPPMIARDVMVAVALLGNAVFQAIRARSALRSSTLCRASASSGDRYLRRGGSDAPTLAEKGG
jgi:hypothetical protein